MDADSKAWKAADIVVWILLAVWACYSAMGTNVFGKVAFPDTMVDYHILYDESHRIVQTGVYPEKHAYPPSGVLLHYATAQFPFPVSAALFLGLSIAAGIACLAVLRRILSLEGKPGGTVLAALALIPAEYAFAWDLRSQNCNVLFLLFVLLGASSLARGSPLQAGAWLALSFSLKLFSVLLLPYLLWRGERRAFLAALGSLVLLWVVLPVAVMGPAVAVEAYRNWLGVLATVSRNAPDPGHPIVVSLLNGAWHLTGDGPAAARIVDACRAAWLALGLLGLAAAWRRKDAPGDGFGLMADLSLLLLAPIAVSPYLEPYHAVPLLVPAMLLLATAADARQRPGLRWAAALLFAASTAAALKSMPFQLRGFSLNAALFVAVGGAVLVAWLRRPPAAAQEVAVPALAAA